MASGGMLPGNTVKSDRQNVCVLRWVQELNSGSFTLEIA